MRRHPNPKPKSRSLRRSSRTKEAPAPRRARTRLPARRGGGRVALRTDARAAATGRIERAVGIILEAIGEDPRRDGLRQTPARVARLYGKVFSGLGRDPRRNFRLFKVRGQDGVVVVKGIPFHSMCEHHLLPFFGSIHLAYLPSDSRVTGLNSLARIATVLSRRPQLQERLTNEIADTVMECLRPRGLLVVIEAQHLCMSLSEGGKRGATAVSSAARGEMTALPRRREALLMMNLGSSADVPRRP